MRTLRSLILAIPLVLAVAPRSRAQSLSLADVTAQAAVVVDRTTGRVLWSKNPTTRRAMASTTKIMTALVAIEVIEASAAAPEYTTECTVSEAAMDDLYDRGGGYGSHATPELVAGEVLSIDELLQAMLIPSDNAACYVLAEALAGSTDAFVTWMNFYAYYTLGLRDTSYSSPNGFDDSAHYTTAADLALLTERAMQKAKFRTIVAMPQLAITGAYHGTSRQHANDSSNAFLSSTSVYYDPEVIGVKTGTTGDAGECLVVAAERNGLSLLTVVLGSEARFDDTAKLLAYGFEQLAPIDTTRYASGDFDGDGFDDLAVGIPQAAAGAGKVALLKGSTTEIKTSAPRTISQSVGSIPGSPEAGDGFGHALAVGDFDRDGYDDLAIGVPWEDHGARVDSGIVAVVYGSATGLDTGRVQDWHQDVAGVPGIDEAYDNFGQSLAAADFDGDGYDDLAIGVPGDDIEASEAIDGGGVIVLYGGPNGLHTGGAVYFHQDSHDGISGVAESGDGFGWSLAAGDFDDDGHADLAIGVPGEDLLTTDDYVESAGMVCIVYGSAAGLDPMFRPFAYLTDDDVNASSVSEHGDQLGRSLAAGDFDADGKDDLAVGAPGEDFGRIDSAGAVLVVYGSASGLAAAGSQFFYESWVNGSSEHGDTFAFALVARDFDGDGDADLAIGVPGEDAGAADEGKVVVLRGGTAGLSTSSVTILNPASNEAHFGAALGAGRFGPDGVSDLCVAIPTYYSGTWRKGATRVFDGESSGLSSGRASTWSGL